MEKDVDTEGGSSGPSGAVQVGPRPPDRVAPEMPALGYALIGTGTVAETQALALQGVPGARLVCVHSRGEGRGRAFARRWRAPWVTSYEQVLARPDVAVVSLCTPSGVRAELAEAAARAGKHVVCEKPLEVTTERADRIIGAADAAGVRLGVVLPQRFSAAARAVHRALAAGRLGRLLLASAEVPWRRTEDYYASASWRGTHALDGGGALINQAIHWVDLLLWFGGPVASVAAFTDRLAHPTIEVEDVGVAVLRFRSGAMGTLAGTTGAFPGRPACVQLYGDRGTIVLGERRILAWDVADATPEERERVLALGGEASAASDPRSIDTEGHRALLEEVTNAIREGRRPEVDGAEGRRSVALVRAIYEAARTRAVVTLPTG